MNITKTLLNELFKSFTARFNKGYNADPHPDDKEALRLADLAMNFSSSGAVTTYTWLGQLPAMRKWVGSRVYKTLNVGKVTVENDDYEGTVTVQRNAIEDDSFGVFADLVQAMGVSARELWLELAVKALKGNAPWADGNPFFCSGRVLADDITMTNAVTTALSGSAVETAIATMISWKLEEGRRAKVYPQRLVVAANLAATARRICDCEFVVAPGGGATESNPLRGKIKFSVCADLPDGAWYLLGDIAGIRAVAVQKRKEPTLTRKDDDTDDNVFDRNEYVYGTHARGAAFLTLPFLAYAGGMANVPAFDATKVPTEAED